MNTKVDIQRIIDDLTCEGIENKPAVNFEAAELLRGLIPPHNDGKGPGIVASLRDLSIWLTAVAIGNWTWLRNSPAKYVTITIDTRRGAMHIADRDGRNLSLRELTHQFGITGYGGSLTIDENDGPPILPDDCSGTLDTTAIQQVIQRGTLPIRLNHGGYPNTPLKEPVRPISSVPSMFKMMREHFTMEHLK